MSDEQPVKKHNTSTEKVQVWPRCIEEKERRKNCDRASWDQRSARLHFPYPRVRSVLFAVQVKSDDPPIDPHSAYQASEKNKDNAGKPVVDEKIVEMVRVTNFFD